MFDFSWGEVMVIGGVALVVIGPKDLPKALRTVGQMTSKVKRLAYEFQSQFNEAMREADLENVKREVEGLNRDVASATSSTFNPLQTIRDELKSSVESKSSASAGAVASPMSPNAAEARFFGETPTSETSASEMPVEEAGPIHHIEPMPAPSDPRTPPDKSVHDGSPATDLQAQDLQTQDRPAHGNVPAPRPEPTPDTMPTEPAGPGLEPAAERVAVVRDARA